MKHLYFFLILSICALGASAQGTVYMKVDGISSPDNGFKLTAFENNATTPFATSPAGAISGNAKVSFDNIKITKAVDASSVHLLQLFLPGKHVAKVEFDFYDGTNTLIYTITLTEAIVSKMSYLSPQCPTCQSLSNEIWMNFSTISYKDVTNNLTYSWNVNTNSGN